MNNKLQIWRGNFEIFLNGEPIYSVYWGEGVKSREELAAVFRLILERWEAPDLPDPEVLGKYCPVTGEKTRQKCNKLTQEERQKLLDAGLEMIESKPKKHIAEQFKFDF